MTRRRTKLAKHRVRKYKKKVIPRITNIIFKENVNWFKANLENYLRLDAYLEQETLKLLEENVKQGLIQESEKDLYLAFWRKIREYGQHFSGQTLEKKIQEAFNEFKDRGLKEEKLKEIIELVKDQLPRKKLKEKLQEWAVLYDYLKFKVFAYVFKPQERGFISYIQAIPTFNYRVIPIPIRVFTIRPQLSLLLYKIALPYAKVQFSYDLRQVLSYNFIYSVYIPPEFRKFLYVRTRFIFYYLRLSPYYATIENSFSVSYQYFTSIVSTYPNLIPLRYNVEGQFYFSVIILPTRYFYQRPHIRLTLGYQLLYTRRIENTHYVNVNSQLLTQSQAYTTSSNQLNPKVSLQFSTSVKTS
jgi:hypothetical protein